MRIDGDWDVLVLCSIRCNTQLQKVISLYGVKKICYTYIEILQLFNHILAFEMNATLVDGHT